MQQIFDFIIDARKAFIKLVDSLTIEQLNKIPDGFNNNIIWNFGHIVVSTQSLCYVRTGVLPDANTIKFNEFYKKGTKPSYIATAGEVAELKLIALESLEKIKADYLEGKLSKVVPFATSTFEVELNSVEEILITTIGHDNLHFGYASALKKLMV